MYKLYIYINCVISSFRLMTKTPKSGFGTQKHNPQQ